MSVPQVSPSPKNPPRLLTARDRIRTVAERWKDQYECDGAWGSTFFGPTKPVYDQLSALNVETATPEDVDRIIGTSGWAAYWCNGCQEYVTLAVEVGDQPDYESSTATLCPACLRAAFDLLPKEPNDG